MSDSPKLPTSFNEGDYARPNQPFRCGRADDGCPCPQGPSPRGVCRVTAECQPYKQADSWICARSAGQGGPCDQGPLPDGTCCRALPPCSPIRSLLSKRGTVSICVFLLAIGCSLVLLTVPGNQGVISPGPLSTSHRQFAQRCQDCHDVGNGKLSDLVHSALSSDAAAQQNQLCLKCHRELGEHAMHPHGSSQKMLASLVKTRNDDDASSNDVIQRMLGGHGQGGSHASLDCATCHREHHHDDSLAMLSDQQCQTCHSRAFDSFSDGHPEFKDYAYTRRTRIAFDHASHYGKHFVSHGYAAETAHACQSCHQSDSAGRFMLVRDFGQSCGQCHQSQIEDDTFPGTTLFTLPALDMETLVAAKIDIGNWPKSYPLHAEARGNVSAIPQLLMSGQDDFDAVYQSISDLQLSDLSAATPEQLVAVGEFAWQFKQMMVTVSGSGHDEIQSRLQRSLSDTISADQIRRLSETLPIELIRQMQDRWLPDAAAEIDARRTGVAIKRLERKTADPAVAIPADRFNQRSVRSGWYLDESGLSLRYRPNGHGDAVLKQFLDLCVCNQTITRSSENTASEDRPSVVSTTLDETHQRLTSAFAVGRCTKCHSIDATDGHNQINWGPSRPDPLQRGFTRFSHAPHVTMLTEDGCTKCHHLKSEDEESANSVPDMYRDLAHKPTTDPSVFRSNFAALQKADCVSCHSAQSHADGCMTCHNYHAQQSP